MTARSVLADVLTTYLPTDGSVRVMAYSREIEAPAKSTVMVRIDTVRPSEHAQGLQDYGFGLVLVAAATEPGAGDDELDALLEDVLFALEKATTAGITWKQANRATYGGNPAYEVTVSVTVTKA